MMNICRSSLIYVLALLATAASLPAHAVAGAAIQSLDSIAAAASARLHAEADAHWRGDSLVQVGVSVGRLDARLRLPACSLPLETDLPPGARPLGPVAVGVRCTAPAWSLFVPARVSVNRPVVVLAVSRNRGATLDKADLVLESRDLATLPGGYLTDIDELVGMQLRRTASAGMVMLPGIAAAPELVQRGERVVLQAAGGTIAVQVEGEALASGALGERVRVRNLATKRVVEGTVGGEGLVIMGLAGLGRVR